SWNFAALFLQIILHEAPAASKRSGAELLQRFFLPALRVEIFGRKPRLESTFPHRPFGIHHREPRGVAIPALDDHVLAENALESETEAFRRAARRCIQRIAFP